MKKVFKYPFPIGAFNLEMPNGAKILHVGIQGHTPCLWAEVSPDDQHELRRFIVHGTGHPIMEDGRKHIETFLDGSFVWHLYEMTP